MSICPPAVAAPPRRADLAQQVNASSATAAPAEVAGGAGNIPLHTPGPWLNRGPFRFITARTPLGGIVIADVVKTDQRPDAEADANAQLIAAAPDLIEALEALLALIDPEGIGTFDGVRDIAALRPTNGEMVFKGSFLERAVNARAAIAKARGQ